GLPGPEELLGKDDQEVLPPELAQRVAERDREILASGEALVDSELSGHGDNGEFWTKTTKLPLRDERGQVVGLVGISQDTTDQHLAERALRGHANRLNAIVAIQRDVASLGLELEPVMQVLCARAAE